MTLRGRLWLIVALTLSSVVATIVVDRITSARLDDELRAIERDYVPLLRYGPEVEEAFRSLRRDMQDAVAAQDEDALRDTAAASDAFVALLERAPRAIPAEKLRELRQSFEAWNTRAMAVSEQLMRGAGGEATVTDIQHMQRLQRELQESIASAVFLDEEALSRAFANARDAQSTAAAIRLGGSSLLIATIVAMLLVIGRRAVRAFASLRQGLERFGRAEFDRAIDISGSDELAELAQSANDMAARIEELQSGLRAQKEAAERARAELETFSYSVSHDLRSPLRGIDGFSQALLEDYGDQLDDTGQDYLRRVRAAAQRMGLLIDDLLSLSRIERVTIQRSRVDLTALAGQIADDLRDSDPGREVDLEIAPGLTARADRALLRVALENLIGNAWKFSRRRARARIEIGGTTEDGGEVFYVRDNGAGFDEAYADKLFGAFQRLHGNSEFEGTGIGLATVHRIVGKHGGTIWARGAVGEGATFYFTLQEKGATDEESNPPG